ncbi:stage 0 sporulation family protein [Melioribacteraceae bacterium 4301-Me]|uniref:PSP1 domain-containing protein n=1 Tax=Pyranulibacter aquaticus TaxID=3163344 RepID=UPI003598767D
MYYIDLSFLKAEESDYTPPQLDIIQTECNNCFKDIITNKLHSNYHNVSACLSSEVEKQMRVPIDTRNIIEVSSEGLLSTNYCEVPPELINKVSSGDFIIVSFDDFLEIAQVKLIGELVKIKRQHYELFGEPLPTVIRKINKDDLERINKNRIDEQKAIKVFKESTAKFGLEMKLVSIHFQFDRKRLFFFYTADGRVDFRELAKDLASIFKTRIELRQVGVRDEAKRIGGIGTCGREYCCTSFLCNFKKITTQLANEQNLLSSMGKLSGPCGKLKCCLSFEIE